MMNDTKDNRQPVGLAPVHGSPSMVGRRVEWTEDMRPMPGQWPGDDEADSPCWDMNLVQRRTGTIVAISRTIFGAWKCLIETDGGFHSGPIEIDIRELRLSKANRD